jgi:hypothetical protein
MLRERVSGGLAAALGTWLAWPGLAAHAQDGDASNAANNPLTPSITVNFHDYYVPDIIGQPDREANQYLQRGLMPHKLFGLPQLFRYTLPVATAPTFPRGSQTGLGDLFLIDFFTLPPLPGKVEVALGPLLVAPTASDDALGQGKWQTGPAVAIIAPQSWGLAGSLIQYQQSFAGDRDREDVKLLTVQPIVTYNLPQGYYLRSSAIWNFDLENNNHFIPLGLGLGNVWKVDERTTANLFVEPQYTVWHEGEGMPRWQIFVGFNLQFATGK